MIDPKFCPYCGSKNIYYSFDKEKYECSECLEKFNIT